MNVRHLTVGTTSTNLNSQILRFCEASSVSEGRQRAGSGHAMLALRTFHLHLESGLEACIVM